MDNNLFESIAIDKKDIGQPPPNPFTAQVSDPDMINVTTKIDHADELEQICSVLPNCSINADDNCSFGPEPDEGLELSFGNESQRVTHDISHIKSEDQPNI